MQIGCCVSPEQVPDAIRAGADFLELPGMRLSSMTEDEFSALKNQLDDAAVKVLAVNAYCDSQVFSVNSAPDINIATAYADTVCRRASVLGAKTVGIGCPSCRVRDTSVSVEAALENFKAFISATAEVAAKYKMKALIEPVNSFLCNTVNTIAEGQQLLAEMNDSRVGFLVDFCHCELMGDDEDSILAALSTADHVHVGHQFAGMPKRDFLRECDRENLRRIFALIKASGCKANVSMEAGGPGDFYSQLCGSLSVLRETAEK